ncbi:MAG: hypothetical protein Q3972_06635 [Corynebacterium sp.]|nr:hypothetical protein [Corynebacterium sp.]
MSINTQQPATTPAEDSGRPNSVWLVYHMMLMLFGLEFIFRAIDLAAAPYRVAEVKEVLAGSAEVEQLERMLGDNTWEALSITMSVTLAVFWLLMAGLALIPARRIYTGKASSMWPRLLVTFMAAYYLYRGVLVFIPLETNNMPSLMYFLWGSTQIFSGIGAILVGLALSKKETLLWIGKK